MRILHKGQYDKAGLPYWRHPLRMVKSFYSLGVTRPEISLNARYEIILIALFHDVIEDVENGDIWLEEFLNNEFPFFKDRVMDSVRLLTKGKDVSYFDYFTKICTSGNISARLVKITDIHDHVKRLALIGDGNIRHRLTKKYKKCMDIYSAMPSLDLESLA